MALQTAVPEQFGDPPLLTSLINVPSALSTSAIPQSHLGHDSVIVMFGPGRDERRLKTRLRVLMNT